MQELRAYIADEVLTRLNFIDGAELNESQEDQIDEIIRDIDNLEITITPRSDKSPKQLPDIKIVNPIPQRVNVTR